MKLLRKHIKEISKTLDLCSELEEMLIDQFCYTLDELKQVVYYHFDIDFKHFNVVGSGITDIDKYKQHKLIHRDEDGNEGFDLYSTTIDDHMGSVSLSIDEIDFYYLTNDNDDKTISILETKLYEHQEFQSTQDSGLTFFMDSYFRDDVIEDYCHNHNMTMEEFLLKAHNLNLLGCNSKSEESKSDSDSDI